MNILAIDTSSAHCSVSLFVAEGQCCSQTKHLPRKHNEFILPMIEAVIAGAGIQKSTIDLLAYGVGPGSFVGVRLSAAIIQAMAWVLDCPVVGFSSMQAIASHAHQHFTAPSISVVLDARMGDVYFGEYLWNEKLQMMENQQESCLKLAEFNHQIAKKNPAFVIGDVIEGMDLKLNSIDYCPDTSVLLPLIQHNYQQLKQQNRLKDIVQPVYLQGISQWKKVL